MEKFDNLFFLIFFNVFYGKRNWIGIGENNDLFRWKCGFKKRDSVRYNYGVKSRSISENLGSFFHL